MNLCFIFTCAFDYEKANVKIIIQTIVTSKARLLNLDSLPLAYAVVLLWTLSMTQQDSAGLSRTKQDKGLVTLVTPFLFSYDF
jgi:hypothetical protein